MPSKSDPTLGSMKHPSIPLQRTKIKLLCFPTSNKTYLTSNRIKDSDAEAERAAVCDLPPGCVLPRVASSSLPARRSCAADGSLCHLELQAVWHSKFHKVSIFFLPHTIAAYWMYLECFFFLFSLAVQSSNMAEMSPKSCTKAKLMQTMPTM